MREHFEDSDGVGAIFPPMIYTVIALRCLGVPDDDPEFVWAMKQLEDLMIAEGDTVRLQPCVSPVWDTALSLIAPGRRRHFAGNPKRCGGASIGCSTAKSAGRATGAGRTRGVEPAGWCFEYRNGFYPDTDDTAMVLMALARCYVSPAR